MIDCKGLTLVPGYTLIIFLTAACNCGELGTPLECTGDEDCGDSDPCTIDRCDIEKNICLHRLGCIRAVSSGQRHACALTYSGGVKCWGYNTTGMLGNGAALHSTLPVDVVGLSSGVSEIDLGVFYSCALMDSGGMKCWGTDTMGALGVGDIDISYSLTPVDVTGLSSGVAGISAGGHTCAVTISGGVKCWGDNVSGQLGDGTTSRKTAPVDVTGLSSGISAVSAGGGHTCALTASGEVKCWGGDGAGQLGNGNDGNCLVCWKETPVDVIGLTSDIAAISLGYFHTCALTSSGGLKCWGENEYGKVGDGTTIHRHVPVDVKGLSSGVASVSAGGRHTCAVMTSGNVKCWGYNYSGQLGDGTTEGSLVPVDVVGLSSDAASIATGSFFSCASLASGEVKCWGRNDDGQLGDGTTLDHLTPAYVLAY